MNRKLLIAGLFLSSCLMVHAQEEEPMNTELDEIVVTGTRTPKLLKDVPVVTRVVSSEEIKRTDATNMQDLLQQELPCAEFSYTMGSQTSLNFQGFSGKDILFLIDGERMAGETLDNVDFTRISMDDVERIEIVKGAASSLYGSNAVGGVINVITKKPVKPWSVRLNSKWGSHREHRHGLNAAFKAKKLSSTTSVQKNGQDPIDLGENSAYKAYGYDTWNIKEKLSYQFNRLFSLSGHAGYFIRERHYSEIQDNRFRDFSGGLRGAFDFNEKNMLEISYLFDQYDKSDFYYDQYDILDYRNVQHTFRTQYTHNFTDSLVLIGGGDVMRDYLMTYQFADTAGKHQYTADLFSQIDWTINKHWNILGGVRYDHFSAASLNHATGKAAVMYKPDDKWNLRLSYAGGFRAPTLKETDQEFLMGGFMYIYGNKELKPESSNNFQLSTEYSKGILNASVSGFVNAFKNRINTRYDSLYYDSKPITRSFRGNMSPAEVEAICDKRDMYAIYENMESLVVSGINADAKLHFDFGVNVGLSYVYTHESNTATSSTRPHAANAKVEYRKDWKNYGFNVGINGRYMSELKTEGRSYEDYMIWKLSLMQHFYKGINLNFVVDNLFGWKPSYYSAVSPTTIGTSFSLSLSLDIDRWFDTTRNKTNTENAKKSVE